MWLVRRHKEDMEEKRPCVLTIQWGQEATVHNTWYRGDEGYVDPAGPRCGEMRPLARPIHGGSLG